MGRAAATAVVVVCLLTVTSYLTGLQRPRCVRQRVEKEEETGNVKFLIKEDIEFIQTKGVLLIKYDDSTTLVLWFTKCSLMVN